MEIFKLWILISAFKIKLSQIQKLFSLWISGIVEKEALFLYCHERLLMPSKDEYANAIVSFSVVANS